MTFQTGKSGNPKGRPRGALSKRTHLAKLLEPHADALIAKAVELGLNGDVNALRLCIERIIPKVQHVETGIDYPTNINELSLTLTKEEILSSALTGKISVTDAEKLIKLFDTHFNRKHPSNLTINTTDPTEAARIYQQIMCQN